MKPYALTILVLLCCITTVSIAKSGAPKKDGPNCWETHIVHYPTKTAGSIEEGDTKLSLKLEVAMTAKSRAEGLMNRKTLTCDGMAFWFPLDERDQTPIFTPQKFWMRNTLIPLDMIFVGESGRIIYIATAKPLSEERVGPDEPVASVIEIAGGRAVKEGIKVGDFVHYEMAMHTWQMAH